MSVVGYDPRRGHYLGGPAFGLAAPLLPVPDARELELLVRFEHPAKFLAVKELPGAALLDHACLARAYGCSPAALELVRSRLEEQLREAAGTLLDDPAVRDAAARFPVPAGGTVLALGDSITDDVQSWAELLRCCLDRARPGDLRVVNAGISGDTTADALARLHAVVELGPDLVLAMLGTNDCQLHGPNRDQLIMPAASLDAIEGISSWLASAGTRVVWLTPPPVDREALIVSAGHRPFDIDDGSRLRLSESLAESGLEVIDTGSQLSPRVAAGDLLPDGVHPTLAGQCRIAATVFRALG
jgi:acyl-CoA thioesterase I